MANWYVSSVAYTAVAQWAASTAFTSGQIVRQLAVPAVNTERCFRCTTAGTSGGTEPTWNLGNNATTTDGSVTWTECTGQEAHQRDNGATTTWTAPAARVGCVMGSGKSTVAASGDTVFCSSDHAETQASALSFSSPTGINSGVPVTQIISVAKSGSVPPVAGDITPGASLATTGANNINLNSMFYAEGLTFSVGTGSSFVFFDMGVAGGQAYQYYKNCTISLPTTSIARVRSVSSLGCSFVWDNTVLHCGSTAQDFEIEASSKFVWMNTTSAIQGAIPSTLFFSNGDAEIYLRGVDLSAMGAGTSLFDGSGNATRYRAVFEDCKLGASVNRVTAVSNTQVHANIQIDFINCDSGATGYKNSWHRGSGDITTETTITRSGGASDGIQAVSFKLVSSGTVTTPLIVPLEVPPISQWNGLTGSSKTATIEINSSASLNNDDIWLELEYLGSSATPLGSFVTSLPATSLTTHAAVPTSTATWNSDPTTPVHQKLQVTFTPQMAGLVIARVKLGKRNTTVYVDPLITIA